jgi:UDP-N-acetylglucosamine diphosphorylase/glucosamine-1-phosphate N-acetyltransferase
MELEGTVLHAPWELMSRNGEQLREDIPHFFPGYAAEELPGCDILGDGLLSLGKNVEVEPGSVFDVREGPIRLSDGAKIRAHTRLTGPAYVGPGTTVLGGVLSEVSLGPVCKVRGEVECSVILGYSNKAHDGFLGHSYLGRWVNLGAFTTNSDLKNNYGPIRVGGSEGPVDTGLMKVGAFLGDHVKTGIGTLLNTGTVVGAGSNLFGGAMPPAYVPPFSWGSGSELVEFRLDKFLEVASRAMGRRQVALDPGMEGLLRRAWERSRDERLRKP